MKGSPLCIDWEFFLASAICFARYLFIDQEYPCYWPVLYAGFCYFGYFALFDRELRVFWNRFVGLSPFGERFSLLVCSVQHLLSFSIKS